MTKEIQNFRVMDWKGVDVRGKIKSSTFGHGNSSIVLIITIKGNDYRSTLHGNTQLLFTAVNSFWLKSELNDPAQLVGCTIHIRWRATSNLPDLEVTKE